MAKKRDLINMTEQEQQDFIESQKGVQVATNGHNGWPHLVSLWFAMDEGDIIIETFTKSQKIKNLERDPRITLMFEDGEDYQDLKGVVVQGTAQLINDPEEVHRLHMLVTVRNAPEGVTAEMLEDSIRAMAPKKTAIRVKADRIISWDHGKLAGVY